MTNIYKLYNQFKYYDWGASDTIPRFLNIYKNAGERHDLPYAEMWMGTHKSAPSRVKQDGETVNLSEVSGDLPFLFKLLAVEKTLSIQVHPDEEQAAEGFEREKKAGVFVNDPARNYKDPNPKHEMICALSPFTLMAGFRKPQLIIASLKSLLSAAPQINEIITPLIHGIEHGSFSSFLKEHFNIYARQPEVLNSFIIEYESGNAEDKITKEQWALMKTLASQYKNDPAILSPLYLNMITLQPGQAIFLPAGNLHAYVSGFGLELMNCSDNVLRGGLTKKHIDINELIKITNFKSFMPEIISPVVISYYSYPLPINDFSLSIVRSNGNEVYFNIYNPSICIVNEGELITGNMKFKKGESFFIRSSADKVMFKGKFSVFLASASK